MVRAIAVTSWTAMFRIRDPTRGVNMKEYSVYFWNGCHTYIKASSYQEAMELAEEQAKGMTTAVDYILAV